MINILQYFELIIIIYNQLRQLKQYYILINKYLFLLHALNFSNNLEKFTSYFQYIICFNVVIIYSN